MATSLAIGYLAARPGNPRCDAAPAKFAQVEKHDSIVSRPPIPQRVVTWREMDTVRAPERPATFARRSLDGVLMGVVGVLLIVLAGAVTWQLDKPATTWVVRDQTPSPLGLIGKVPVVELRILGYEPVATPARADEGAVTLSSTAAATRAAN